MLPPEGQLPAAELMFLKLHLEANVSSTAREWERGGTAEGARQAGRDPLTRPCALSQMRLNAPRLIVPASTLMAERTVSTTCAHVMIECGHARGT